MANRIKSFEVLNSSKTRLKIRSSIKCIATLQEDVVSIANTMNDVANDFSELTVNRMKSSDFIDASRDVVKKTNLINAYMKDCMKAIFLDTQTRIESIADNSQAYKDDLVSSQAAISAALAAFDGLGDVKMSDVKMDLTPSGGDTKPDTPATTEQKPTTVAPDASDSDTPTAAADFADTTGTTTDPTPADPAPATTTDPTPAPADTPKTVYDPTENKLFGAADAFLNGDVNAARISESSHLINPNSVHSYAKGDPATIMPSLPTYAAYDGMNSIEPHSLINDAQRAARAQDLSDKLAYIEVPIWDGEKMGTMHLTVNDGIKDNYTNLFTQLANEHFPVKPSVTGSYNSANANSDHYTGAAFDINPGDNPYGGTPANNEYGVTERVIELAAANGFYWGGDWTGSATKDPMHFSYLGC